MCRNYRNAKEESVKINFSANILFNSGHFPSSNLIGPNYLEFPKWLLFTNDLQLVILVMNLLNLTYKHFHFLVLRGVCGVSKKSWTFLLDLTRLIYSLVSHQDAQIKPKKNILNLHNMDRGILVLFKLLQFDTLKVDVHQGVKGHYGFIWNEGKQIFLFLEIWLARMSLRSSFIRWF